MSDNRLGQKHTCFHCGAKFYDFNRDEVECPRCGANQSEAPKGTDMAAIAAKVLASSVTDSDEPGEGYGPVADEMDLFGADVPGGGKTAGTSIEGTDTEESAEPDFDDDEF